MQASTRVTRTRIDSLNKAHVLSEVLGFSVPCLCFFIAFRDDLTEAEQ